MSREHSRTSVAKELLQHLMVPAGTTNVILKRGGDTEELVVEIAPGVRLAENRKPLIFQGIPVIYMRRKPAKALG